MTTTVSSLWSGGLWLWGLSRNSFVPISRALPADRREQGGAHLHPVFCRIRWRCSLSSPIPSWSFWSQPTPSSSKHSSALSAKGKQLQRNAFKCKIVHQVMLIATPTCHLLAKSESYGKKCLRKQTWSQNQRRVQTGPQEWHREESHTCLAASGGALLLLGTPCPGQRGQDIPRLGSPALVFGG